MPCLYCPEGATLCAVCDPTKRADPAASFPNATATQRRNAKKGRHAMGHAMPGPAGETCGSCGHRKSTATSDGKLAFSKCSLSSQTQGKATDTRRTWPACARWTGRSA